MSVAPKLQIQTRQHTHLAPQLHVALGLMQRSQLELLAYIKDMALGNPMLVVDDAEPLKTAPSNQSTQHSDITQWAQDTTLGNLKSHLYQQSLLAGFGPRDQAIADCLINSLDDQGLLQSSLGTLVDEINHLLAPDCFTSGEISCVLRKIQSFDPAGVGASSIQQSLILQLEREHSKHARYRLAHDLLNHHFDKLDTIDHACFCRRLDVSKAHVDEAVALIQKLNPNPGSVFDDTQTHYITPDLFVAPHRSEAGSTGWTLRINHDALPSIRLDTHYLKLIDHAGADVRRYLTQKRLEAEALLTGLRLRDQTLVKVARCLIERQQRVLFDGPEHIQPLKQADIAQALGLSISTVCRITTNKYVQTPRGIIELKALFSRAVACHQRRPVGRGAVFYQIKDWVAEENKTQPLTDQAIATRLSGNGVKIARRTVTKYRKRMGIAGSMQRRCHPTWPTGRSS